VFILIVFENSGHYSREKAGKFKHDQYNKIFLTKEAYG